MQPTEKSRKYDRQLRIWGENGQAALEAASVCLINGGCLGTEIFKNLVLPGVGSITVVDGHTVCARDLGNNFFVTQAHVGQPRAKVAAELLQELNEDVDASKFVAEEPSALIARSPEFFDEFAAVVATQLEEGPLRELGRRCWANGVPLITAKINGFVGYTRIVMPELCIVESKPDAALQDLRVPRPFPELLEISDAMDMDVEDGATHSHIPWIIILMQTLGEWKAEKGTDGPANIKEKREFKKLVQSKNRGMEENFTEAHAQAHYAYTHPVVPDEVSAILMDPCCSNISANATSSAPGFWVAMRALRDFVEQNGALPLTGSIPDMTSGSATYLALQHAFQKRAAIDIATVSARVAELVAEHGCTPLTEEYIKMVCKNAYNLRVKRFSSVEKEYTEGWARPLAPLLDGSQSFTGEADPNALFYLMLRASEKFVTAHGRHPGDVSGGAPADDIPLLLAELKALLTPDCGLGEAYIGAVMAVGESTYVPEMCRVGGAELHTTGATLGGMVSQELIKVLTTQFVPVDGGFLMNMLDNTATRIPMQP